mmetsp:Transcript_59872/g.134694  ORF Transcript_59872/g.134694 Transcript_59872/m.134694 type:complete len:387 (-) Transcript_59872:242-1402(-)
MPWLHQHLPDPLHDAATALGAAAAPAAPVGQAAVHGTGLLRTPLDPLQGRAGCTSHRVHEDAPRDCLGSASARGGALLAHPLRDLAVEEVRGVAVHLLQPVADLSESADLALDAPDRLEALRRHGGPLGLQLMQLLCLVVQALVGRVLLCHGCRQLRLRAPAAGLQVLDLRVVVALGLPARCARRLELSAQGVPLLQRLGPQAQEVVPHLLARGGAPQRAACRQARQLRALPRSLAPLHGCKQRGRGNRGRPVPACPPPTATLGEEQALRAAPCRPLRPLHEADVLQHHGQLPSQARRFLRALPGEHREHLLSRGRPAFQAIDLRLRCQNVPVCLGRVRRLDAELLPRRLQDAPLRLLVVRALSALEVLLLLGVCDEAVQHPQGGL